jgi:amino acid permease
MSSVQEGTPLLTVSTGVPVVEQGNSSLFGSIINLTNTIIGAGLLSIPFAFRVAGIVPALACLVFIWLLSSLSFDVLARSAAYTQKYTYKEIAIQTSGHALGYFAELCIVCYTFLNLIGVRILSLLLYFVVLTHTRKRTILISEFLTSVFSQWVSEGSVLLERWFIILIVSIIIFPYVC